MSTWLSVTFPLALVNFLNQASRAVLALIGPLLAVEFGLSAAELGLLAAVFFVAYAAAQLPVGLALDMFGARRVQTALALTACAGFAICAASSGPVMLGAGRLVNGIGISAGLMAMLKANAQWFPKARVAAMTGSGLFVGALGGVAATLPLQGILPILGWRGGFAILAGAAALIALWIWRCVPDAPPSAVRAPRRSLGAEAAAFGPIFAHPHFLRFVPGIMTLAGLNFVYQGLWAGPWLRDVAGLDEAARAGVLFCYAGGLALGSFATGQAASLLQARGASPMLVPLIGMGVQLGMQLLLMLAPPAGLGALTLAWFAFAFFGAASPAGYAAVGQRFGAELAGRVATAINLLMLVLVCSVQYAIGGILDLWPRSAAGGWDRAGYAWAMALTATLQALALVWAWRAPALLPASRR